MASSRSWLRPARWLIVPAVLALFVMLGLAVSAEGRDDFENRLEQGGQSGSSGDDASLPDGSAPGDPPAGSGRPGESGSAGGDSQAIDEGGGGGSEPMSFEVRGEGGSVGVQLGADPATSPVAFPQAGDGTPGEQRPLLPSSGELLRLGDGTLTPVDESEIAPGDIVLRPTSGGVDFIREDGSRVEVRVDQSSGPSGPSGPSDENGDGLADVVIITDVGADGVTETLVPTGNGQIDIGDGVTIQLGTEPENPTLWDQATTTPWRWFVLAIVALVAASLGMAYYLHRVRPPEPFGSDFVGAGGIPADRFEEFLAMLLADDDPPRAIRLAFEAAEKGMGTLAAREEAETPFEWWARVGADQESVSPTLGSLCSRFATVRFAPQRPTAADRDAAVAELRSLAELAHYRPTTVGSPQQTAALAR